MNDIPYVTSEYTGPYWSGGKWQPSVKSFLSRDKVDPSFPKARGPLDKTSRVHDHVYASTKNPRVLDAADRWYVKQNMGKGFWRTLSAKAVLRQQQLRVRSPLGGSGGFKKKKIMYTPIQNRMVVDDPFNPTPGPTPGNRKSYNPRSLRRLKPTYVGPVGSYKYSKAYKPKTASGRSGPPSGGYARGRTRSGRSFRGRKVTKKRRAAKKKADKFSSVNFLKKGSIKHVEYGSVEKDDSASPKSLWLGLYCPQVEVGKSLARAICKLLFAKAGITIGNWDDKIGFDQKNDLTVNFKYSQFDVADVLSSNSVDQNANTTTYTEFADSIAAKITSIITATSTSEIKGLNWRSLTLVEVELRGSADQHFQNLSQIFCCDYGFDSKVISRMTCQNQTTPSVGENTTTDVRNNPLKYTGYKINGNNWTHKARTGVQTGAAANQDINALTSSTLNGLIKAKYTDLNQIPMQTAVRTSYFYGAKSDKKGTFFPGTLMKFGTSRAQSWSWNKCFMALGQLLALPNTPRVVNRHFAASVLYCFEKVIDTRVVGEQAVSVGIQYSHDIMFMTHKRKKGYAPQIVFDEDIDGP